MRMMTVGDNGRDTDHENNNDAVVMLIPRLAMIFASRDTLRTEHFVWPTSNVVYGGAIEPNI